MSTHSDFLTIYSVPDGMDEFKLQNLLERCQAGIKVRSFEKVPDTRHLKVTFYGQVDVTNLSRSCRREEVLILPEIGRTAKVEVDPSWLDLIEATGMGLDMLKSGVLVSRSQSSLVLEGKLSGIQEVLRLIETSVVRVFDESVIASRASVNSHPQINGDEGKSGDHRDRYKGKYSNADDHDQRLPNGSNTDKEGTLKRAGGPTLGRDLNSSTGAIGTQSDEGRGIRKQGIGTHHDQTVNTTLQNERGGIVTQEIEEHIWKYLESRLPDYVTHWKKVLSPVTVSKVSRVVIQLQGTAKDLDEFNEVCTWYNYMKLKKVRIIVPPGADFRAIERLAKDCEVIASRNLAGDYELIGRSERLPKAKTLVVEYFGDMTLRQTEPNASLLARNSPSSTAAAATASSVHAFSSSNGVDKNGIPSANADVFDDNDASLLSQSSTSGISQMQGAVEDVSLSSAASIPRGAVGGSSSRSLRSTDCMQFKTPSAKLQVEVYTGDLTKQKVDVIVNAANSRLLHGGGAARAIADAAGNELKRESEKYIREKGKIRTSEVMHTTSGRMKPYIKYVIHAVGPKYSEVSSDANCKHLLERTFHNCFTYANDMLHCSSIAIPAISSGTFGVPWSIVVSAAYNALMSFDSYMASLTTTRASKQFLTRICFVNIDTDITQHLINTFAALIGNVSLSLASSVKMTVPNATSLSTARTVASRSKVNQPMKALANGVVLTSGHKVTCCVCNKVLDAMVVKTKDCKHECCDKRLCKESACKKCLGTKPMPMPASKRPSDEPMNRVEPSSDIHQAARAKRRRSFSGSIGTSKPSNGSLDTNGDKSKDGSSNSADEDEFSRDDVPLRRSNSFNTFDRKKPKCVICMEDITNPKTLECKHSFCTECIDLSFRHNPKCPCCGRIYGSLRGNQPDGTMKVRKSKIDLDGHRGAGCIIIDYSFPPGLQNDNHPNPRRKYQGTSRTAYLPGSPEGEEILELLRKAFDAGLVFTIGRSVTTGEDGVIVWNDIHHKTSERGPYGYPDYTYLTRVRQELAAKGITSTVSASTTSSAIGRATATTNYATSISTTSAAIGSATTAGLYTTTTSTSRAAHASDRSMSARSNTATASTTFDVTSRSTASSQAYNSTSGNTTTSSRSSKRVEDYVLATDAGSHLKAGGVVREAWVENPYPVSSLTTSRDRSDARNVATASTRYDPDYYHSLYSSYSGASGRSGSSVSHTTATSYVPTSRDLYGVSGMTGMFSSLTVTAASGMTHRSVPSSSSATGRGSRSSTFTDSSSNYSSSHRHTKPWS